MNHFLPKYWGIFPLILFLFSCTHDELPVQEFEGVVTYSIQITPKNKNIDRQKIQTQFGNEMTYTYKNGNYKIEFNGTVSPTIYYIAEDDYQYSIFPYGDTIWASDCTLEEAELLALNKLKESQTILNAECEVVEGKLEGDLSYTFFFDPKRFIDPVHFANHKMGYINRFYENGKGLVLQYIRDGKNYTLTQTAIKVEEKKIDVNTFNLPDLPRKCMDIWDY